MGQKNVLTRSAYPSLTVVGEIVYIVPFREALSVLLHNPVYYKEVLNY